jgi:hypothetical protein
MFQHELLHSHNWLYIVRSLDYSLRSSAWGIDPWTLDSTGNSVLDVQADEAIAVPMPLLLKMIIYSLDS